MSPTGDWQSFYVRLAQIDAQEEARENEVVHLLRSVKEVLQTTDVARARTSASVETRAGYARAGFSHADLV